MNDPSDAPRRMPGWLMPVAVVVAVIAGVWAWPGSELSAPPAPSATGEVTLRGDAPPSVPTAIVDRETVAERSNPISERSAVAADESHPQGLRGFVLDASSNQPIADIEVHLVESAGNEPLLLPLMREQHHFLAPVATARTETDGTFALGLEVVQDKVYEVYVVSPRHATARLSGLRLLAGTWHDLGAITLDAGAILKGRVTVAGRPNMPVPQAVVTLETGGAFADAALRALPGGQGDLIAHVDAAGFYELPRAPTRGVVRLSALAPGFARITKQDIELSTQNPIQVDFALPPGQSLVGDVRTAAGTAIAGARVEAWPKKSGQAPLVAFSDEQGDFVLHGLRPAPHRLRVSARGHETLKQEAVEPNQTVHLVLARRSRVQVIARTPTGEVLRRYRLGLRRFFPADRTAPLDQRALQHGQIGAVTEVPEQHVRLDANTIAAELTGIPAGVFVCEVEADGYAKTLSAPIRCGKDRAPSPSTIEVVLTRGVRLRGQVLDFAGKALVGATIRTQTNGSMPDSPLFRMLAGAVPRKITQRTVKSGPGGLFTLELLALADYQLQIDHDDACRTYVRDLQLDSAGDRALPAIQLMAGAIVQGSATVDGRVAGQMKVVLTTPQTATAETSLRLETITDAAGRYRFARRIPPGDYQLRAAVVGATAPDAEIFHQLLQMKRSSTTFTVAPGQGVVERDLDLPSAN